MVSRFGKVLNQLDFLFLDVARLLGLTPEVAAGTGNTDLGKGSGGSEGVSQHCGILRVQ